METIEKVKHENLVPLLGYCMFADERFLIYEYMENGSLYFLLRNQANEVGSGLELQARFRICLGSARGLAFSHHGFVLQVIHQDIKSSNMLLDRNFEARVSDIGLARIISACETHISTMLAGTFGYIPPEYNSQTMLATAKGDVYIFGVVMVATPFSVSGVWKDQMVRVLGIARSCTEDEPLMRPSMLEVVKMLKLAKVA